MVPSAMRTRGCFDTTMKCRDQSDDGLPRGEELAMHFAEGLRNAGLEPGDVDADSWSWFFDVKFGSSRAEVHVAWQKEADFKHIPQE